MQLMILSGSGGFTHVFLDANQLLTASLALRMMEGPSALMRTEMQGFTV